jgi:hypothetical protein
MVFPLDLTDPKQKYTTAVLFVLLLLLMVSSSISISNYNAIKGAESLMAVQNVDLTGTGVTGTGAGSDPSDTLEASALKLEASNGWSIFVLILSICGIGAGAGMIVYDKVKV